MLAYPGLGEIDFSQPENVLQAVVYTVMKKQDRAATLIALFQRKGLTVPEALEDFPEGRNFNFLDEKLKGFLQYQRVPEGDAGRILEALHRGGKVIWHGQDKSLMIEITPGDPGWKWGGVMRPKGKR